jgi:hypothetical protein
VAHVGATLTMPVLCRTITSTSARSNDDNDGKVVAQLIRSSI